MTMSAVLLSKVATAIAIPAEVARRKARPELAYAFGASVLAVLLIPAVVAVPLPASLSASFRGFETNWLDEAILGGVTFV
jgi:hypothetical protein